MQVQQRIKVSNIINMNVFTTMEVNRCTDETPAHKRTHSQKPFRMQSINSYSYLTSKFDFHTLSTLELAVRVQFIIVSQMQCAMFRFNFVAEMWNSVKSKLISLCDVSFSLSLFFGFCRRFAHAACDAGQNETTTDRLHIPAITRIGKTIQTE